MSDYGEFRAWGYTLADIEKMKRERLAYRFALQTIAFGTFGKGPCRDVRSARGIAIRSLLKDRA